MNSNLVHAAVGDIVRSEDGECYLIEYLDADIAHLRPLANPAGGVETVECPIRSSLVVRDGRYVPNEPLVY